jgi:hypothetical protein
MDRIQPLLGSVATDLKEGGAQARKRILSGDPYRKVITDDVFEIYTWERVDDDWYALCVHVKTGTWYHVLEDLFDWDKPDMELTYWEARRWLQLQTVE